LAPQLKRKAVNRPNAEANLLGNLHDACSLPKLGTGVFKGGRVIEWPAKSFAVRNGPLKASMDPLPDHAALKLGKGTNDLKHQFAGWRCGVRHEPVSCGYLLRPTGNPTFLSLMWLGKSNKFLLRYVKVERCVMW
jgi:hypothetical protein